MVRLGTRHAAALLLLAVYVCSTTGPVVAASLRGVPDRVEIDCCGALHPGKACPMARHGRAAHDARLSCGCTADDLAPGGTIAAVPPPAIAATLAAPAVAFHPPCDDRLLDRPTPITVPPPRG
jgi:hypothetical protein